MFSGIVEEAAQVVALQSDKGNLHLTMKCSFVNELKIDQSVAHNGVCLTVVSMTEDTYTVTAIKETLERSNLGNLKVGDKVNLERSMLMNGRLDGHIVQGHVDQTAVCAEVKDCLLYTSRGVEGLSANKRWHRSHDATTDTRDRDRHPIHEFWRLDLYDDRHQDEILRSLYHLSLIHIYSGSERRFD